MTISSCIEAWLHKLLRTRNVLPAKHQKHNATSCLNVTLDNSQHDISSTSQRLCNVDKSTPSGDSPVRKRQARHRMVKHSKKRGLLFLYVLITVIGRNI